MDLSCAVCNKTITSFLETSCLCNGCKNVCAACHYSSLYFAKTSTCKYCWSNVGQSIKFCSVSPTLSPSYVLVQSTNSFSVYVDSTLIDYYYSLISLNCPLCDNIANNVLEWHEHLTSHSYQSCSSCFDIHNIFPHVLFNDCVKKSNNNLQIMCRCVDTSSTICEFCSRFYSNNNICKHVVCSCGKMFLNNRLFDIHKLSCKKYQSINDKVKINKSLNNSLPQKKYNDGMVFGIHDVHTLNNRVHDLDYLFNRSPIKYSLNSNCSVKMCLLEILSVIGNAPTPCINHKCKASHHREYLCNIDNPSSVHLDTCLFSHRMSSCNVRYNLTSEDDLTINANRINELIIRYAAITK